jgi:hypothetical protein
MADSSAISEAFDNGTIDLLRELSEAFAPAGPTATYQRSSPRFPLNFSMKLFPLGGRGKRLHFAPMEITGRDISGNGLGFIHEHKIPTQRVIIYCFRPGVARFAFEAQVVWTASSPHGGYESGCTLVRKLPPSEIAEML